MINILPIPAVCIYPTILLVRRYITIFVEIEASQNKQGPENKLYPIRTSFIQNIKTAKRRKMDLHYTTVL